MKKAFLVLILISALFIIFPSNIQAVGLINPVSDAFKDFATSISTISRWIRPVAVLLYLAMLLYAGYIRLTAGADPEKSEKGYFNNRLFHYWFCINYAGTIDNCDNRSNFWH